MDDVFRIRDLVYDVTGMFFSDTKRPYLEGKFRRRMDVLGLEEYGAYFLRLKNGKIHQDEFTALMDEITVSETRFFRNEEQLAGLRRSVMPELIAGIKARGERVFRVWSAGCSTGEEAYSLAMIADGACAAEDIRASVIATDISQRVIEIAEEGVYSESAIRGLPDDFRGKYLEVCDKGYRIIDALRQRVTFRTLNLMDLDADSDHAPYHLVVCKNVIIYFESTAREKAVSALCGKMTDGGVLVVGTSESLYGIDHSLRLIHFPGGMAYRKTGEE